MCCSLPHAFPRPHCTATLPIPSALSLQLIIPTGAENRCYVEMEPQVVQFRTDSLEDPDSHSIDTVMAHEVRRPLDPPAWAAGPAAMRRARVTHAAHVPPALFAS